MHKQLFLLATIVYTVVLVVLSLINLSGVPSLGSSFDDKIYHLFAYLILGFMWATYFKFNNSRTTNWIVFIAVILFGIVLELVQHQLNENRTYDSFDLIANCFGGVIGTLIAHKLNVIKLK